MSDYSHRIKLKGGRNVHAAGYTFSDQLTTPCGYVVGRSDQSLDGNAQVTCLSCQKVLENDR